MLAELASPEVDAQHRIQVLELALKTSRARVKHMCSTLVTLRDHLLNSCACPVGRGCRGCQEGAAICVEAINEHCPPDKKKP